MRIVLFLFLNIVFCVMYYLMITIVNYYFPIGHFTTADGILFYGATLILFLCQLIAMALVLNVKVNNIVYGPIIILIVYWLVNTNGYPYRKYILLFLSVTYYISYLILLRRFLFIGKK